MNCHEKLTKEKGRELSAKYRALTEEERKPLRELAAMGLEIGKATGRSFGKRRRSTGTGSVSTGTRSALVAIEGDADGDHEGRRRAALLDADLQQSQFVQTAKMARKAAMDVQKEKRQQDEGLQMALGDGSRTAVPVAWNTTMLVQPEQTAPMVPVRKDEFSKVATTVPCATYAAHVQPSRLDDLVGGRMAELSQRWRDRHIGIVHKTQPPIEAPPHSGDVSGSGVVCLLRAWQAASEVPHEA